MVNPPTLTVVRKQPSRRTSVRKRSLCSRRLAPAAGLLACVGSLTRAGMPAFLMAGLFGFA